MHESQLQLTEVWQALTAVLTSASGETRTRTRIGSEVEWGLLAVLPSYSGVPLPLLMSSTAQRAR
jgi:hypothetical protein